MVYVHNRDGKLVCKINELNGDIEIEIKNCKTVIRYRPDGKPEIENYERSTKR